MSAIPQPLHPDIISRLDPEYVAFHNAKLAHIIPPHTLAWDPAIRNGPAVPGGAEPLQVGSIEDYTLDNCRVKVFTPEGSPPASGWPVFIFFHGGGWTLGNIASESSFCTNMCKRARCLVVSVDYRLAPENPFPAAVEDAVNALRWMHLQGESLLQANISKIAIGGSSSGGNIAAVLAMKASLLPQPIALIFQLLIVPVTDNTASEIGEPHVSWFENANTPWLSPARMMWFRSNYLPNKENRESWESSPLLAPDELTAKSPKTWIAVTELDILRDEGLAYGEKLRRSGVDTEVKIYHRAPHPIMAMDGPKYFSHLSVPDNLQRVLTVGRQLVSDAAEALANAFN